MMSATMNIIGQTSMMNMRFGSQGSGSNLRSTSNLKEKENSSSLQIPLVSHPNNTERISSTNLQNTIVLEEDEKPIT